MFLMYCDLHVWFFIQHKYLFYNGHIVLNNTAQFVYSTLNLYVYIHWILDFKYILLLLLKQFSRIMVNNIFD